MEINLGKGAKIASMIGIGVFVACFNVVAGTFLLKYGWAKISIILFPGLVESGGVSQFLTFWDAFYVALFIYFILKAFTTGIATINNTKDDK